MRCSSDRNGSSGRSRCSCGGVVSSNIYGSSDRSGSVSCGSNGTGSRRGISDINSSRSFLDLKLCSEYSMFSFG